MRQPFLAHSGGGSQRSQPKPERTALAQLAFKI